MTPSLRFFTPDLYRRIQHGPEHAEPAWSRALDDYQASLADLRAVCPPRLRELMLEIGLHDAEIDVVDFRPGAASLVLEVRGGIGFADAEEVIPVRYDGVLEVAAIRAGTVRDAGPAEPIDLGAIVGADWLYDELRLVAGALEHHVMVASPQNALALFCVRFAGLVHDR